MGHNPADFNFQTFFLVGIFNLMMVFRFLICFKLFSVFLSSDGILISRISRCMIDHSQVMRE
jgi:hypothetical protein